MTLNEYMPNHPGWELSPGGEKRVKELDAAFEFADGKSCLVSIGRSLESFLDSGYFSHEFFKKHPAHPFVGLRIRPVNAPPVEPVFVAEVIARKVLSPDEVELAEDYWAQRTIAEAFCERAFWETAPIPKEAGG